MSDKIQIVEREGYKPSKYFRILLNGREAYVSAIKFFADSQNDNLLIFGRSLRQLHYNTDDIEEIIIITKQTNKHPLSYDHCPKCNKKQGDSIHKKNNKYYFQCNKCNYTETI